MSKENSSTGSRAKQQSLWDNGDKGRKAGADVSNTAPASSSSPILPGGLDWLQVSVYGEWSEAEYDDLTNRLRSAQSLAKQADEPAVAAHVDGSAVYINPMGARHGGFYCQFVVMWKGIEFHIVDDVEEHETRPSGVVRLRSEVLMSVGDREAWALAERLMAGLGFSKSRDIVSRVDLCVDIADLDVGALSVAFFEGRYVSQARKGALYCDGARWTGFWSGTKACGIRVYDKLLEVQEKGNEAKYQALVGRWGGEPKSATRVEYQVRRNVLRDSWGVEGVEDMWEKMPAIIEYLCGKWFRLTVEAVRGDAGKNQAHAKVAEVWEKVKGKFLEWAGSGPQKIERRKGKRPCTDRLKALMKGCIASILSLDMEWMLSPEQSFDELMWEVGQEFARIEDRARARYEKRLALVGPGAT